jgi:hypothetical protein
VTVREPEVLRVTVKFFVPLTRAAFEGSVAAESDEVIATVWVWVVTLFQFASTAFTVAVNELPAVCAVGVPVLPDDVPGAAVSPGRSTCSFVAALALTVTEPDVSAVRAPDWSVAVTVADPAVLKVTEKVPVPAVSAAFAGNVALASVLVTATVGVAVVTTFQFASTAFTVTVTADPAVCAVLDPVFPDTVPGAAVSPGSSTCNLDAGPAVPVAVKVTGEPESPVAVADIVLAPAAAPSVHDPTDALPEAFVVVVRDVPEPPPDATVKVTDVPDTALPPESVTTTDGATATADPTVADCPFPARAASVTAVPTVTVMLCVAAVSAPEE